MGSWSGNGVYGMVLCLYFCNQNFSLVLIPLWPSFVPSRLVNFTEMVVHLANQTKENKTKLRCG